MKRKIGTKREESKFVTSCWKNDGQVKCGRIVNDLMADAGTTHTHTHTGQERERARSSAAFAKGIATFELISGSH